MDLLQLQNIDLGPDPKSIYTLKGSLVDFYFAPDFVEKGRSVIRIRVEVDYYEDGVKIESKRFEPFTKEHYSENDKLVNELGEVVSEGGVMGETDFFIIYVESSLIDFFGAIYKKIMEAKDRGVYYI